jgi:hypothetical protein
MYAKQSRRWPRQPRPTYAYWTIWRAIIMNVFGTDDNGKLHNRIGEWTPIPVDWIWWYIPEEDRLFELTDDCIYFRSKRNRGRRSPRHAQSYDTPRIFQDPLTFVVPATTYPYAQAIAMDSTAYDFTDPPEQPPSEHWTDNIQLQRSHHFHTLRDALIQGSAIEVADGLYKEPFATAGWI